MERYVVRIYDVYGETLYESLGRGQSPYKEDAHLYTRLELAQKKVAYYKKYPQWYRDAEIVTVNVTGF